MEEKNRENLDQVKENAAQLKGKMTKFCDAQAQKAMNLLKKSVPAVEECAKDPAKLSKTILVINIAATLFMLFAFYVLPASPNIKGDGSMSLSSLINLFKSVPFEALIENLNVGLILFIGRALFFVTYVNLALGLYTLFTDKVIPYVSNRLLSLLIPCLMILLLLVMISSALIGVYIALLASIVVALSGLVMVSKK